MDSNESFIPPLRREVQFIPVHHQGQDVLVVHDSMMYAHPNLVFPIEIQDILSLFNGYVRWSQLSDYGFDENHIEELKSFAKLLDENGLIQSVSFSKRKRQIDDDFLNAPIRLPICNGNTYPNDSEKLRSLLDGALSQVENSSLKGEPVALYAPHIDFKVNMSVYAKAFKKLKTLKPKHIWLIGTSHYSGMWHDYDDFPFQISRKDFQIPGRLIKNNIERTEAFAESVSGLGATKMDWSHRMEHSLELHLIWASHIWKHHFTITPILVGSFEDTLYLKDSVLEQRAKEFSQTLLNTVEEDDFILISGDLSHIGLKFGDDLPANELRESDMAYDRKYIQALSKVDPEFIFQMQRAEKDRFKICGFPPAQSVLSSQPNWRGEEIAYDYWDESETQSGVSFASVLFYKK